MMARAPFPYFGGKSQIASTVWEALGDVPSYIEPFCGSAAVLLARPAWHRGKAETLNDADCHVANFWRALQAAPDEVARWADWPRNEADLHARQRWLMTAPEVTAWRERMHSDPDCYDAKIAGWWVWGASTAIPGNWLFSTGLRARPHAKPRGIHAGRTDLAALAERLRCVLVLCGDWERCVSSNSAILLSWVARAGVFLDPPYAGPAGRYAHLYVEDSATVANAAAEWALAHGDDPRLRIVLCGYEGERAMPDSWREIAWTAHGGMAHIGNGAGRQNRRRERLWLSPHCLDVETPQGAQLALLEDAP
jgi:DNA adenine methylase